MKSLCDFIYVFNKQQADCEYPLILLWKRTKHGLQKVDRFDEILLLLNNRRMELEASEGMKIYNMMCYWELRISKTPEYIKTVAEAAMDDNNWKLMLTICELLDTNLYLL